jgi:hypothetical protein
MKNHFKNEAMLMWLIPAAVIVIGLLAAIIVPNLCSRHIIRC